jgi:hypothetical protein
LNGNATTATTAGSATTAGKATNIAGGSLGEIPYQTGANTTGFLPTSTSGYVLSWGSLTPIWTRSATSAQNLDTSSVGGSSTGRIPYQADTAGYTTSYLNIGTSGQVLTVNSGSTAPQWSTNFAGNASTATTSTNLSGGTTGSLPYQSTLAGSTTSMLGIGSSNAILTSNGSTPTWRTGIVGVTDGSNASSGYVGEWIASNVASGSAITLTTSGTVYSITSITLGAGDWNVSASVNIHLPTPGVTMTTTRGGISTANNALTVPSTSTTGVASNSYDTFASLISTSGSTSISTTLGLGGDLLLATKTSRVNLSGSVTLYLVATAQFTGGTAPTAYGTIEARRVR